MAIGVVCLMAFFACSKDETMKNDYVEAIIRNDYRVTKIDSTKNDSTYHGITVNTDWNGERHINF